MNKNLFLIGFMLTTFASSVFGQVDVLSFSDSARKRATAGIYSSDSDNISAQYIFDIDRTIFSAGYVPSLTEGGEYANVGTMSGFWAMPLNKTMTIGFAGEYQMNASKKDNAGESTDYAGNASFDGVNDSALSGVHAVYQEQIITENSAFNLRPVFKFGNMAFHYRISRDSAARVTTIESITGVDNDTKYYEYTSVNSNPNWQHEIGFAFNASKFTIYVPLGFDIQMNGTTTTKSTNNTVEPNKTVNSTTTKEITYMYINPEFTMDVSLGRMTQFKVGLDTAFQLYNGNGSTIYTNTTGTTVDTQTDVYEGQGYAYFHLYFTPTLEWKLWNNKADFTIEPTAGLKFAHRDYGTFDDGTSDNIVSPYAKLAIGTLICPVNWFEFRTGISYGLNWENTIISQQYENSTSSYSSWTYKCYSQFNVHTGFGFIIGEDFFIDVYVQAGQDTELALDAETSGNDSLFNINAYGAQLTYRF